MPQIHRTEPWEPLREDLTARFGRLFGLARTGNGHREALAFTDWAPAVDISETEGQYRICAELPSVKREDVHVTLERGLLTIEGQRKDEPVEKGQRSVRREIRYGHFLRRFEMSGDADESSIDALFKDGMLELVIAKTKTKKPEGSREILVH